MNIIEAMNDRQLFRPFLQDREGSLRTWLNWKIAIKCLYGLPIPSSAHELVKECTGRDVDSMPAEGFRVALFLTGRRCGKSRIASVVGAFESALAGHESKLSPGEKGVVSISAPTLRQSKIVKDYIRAIFEAELLRGEIAREVADGFELGNQTMIQVLAADWRTIRGHTLLAAIVDELAFMGLELDARVRSDSELIRAILPALATTNGRLIGISSPYARKGWCFKTWQENFGNPNGNILVWNCPSRTMNPTLDQKIVDEALQNDRAAALSEFFGQFREDVAALLPRSVVEQAVVKNRVELLPRQRIGYRGFVDVSGGRGDDAAIAIAHREGRKTVVDFLKRYTAPFNPHQVVRLMADELRRYGLRRVVGDNYSAEFVAQAFEANGIHYVKAEQPKSALYIELLPRLCSGEVELVDDELLVDQLANLERRTRSGGKDIVDHPPGAHDDVANAVAGVVVETSKANIRLGVFK